MSKNTPMSKNASSGAPLTAALQAPFAEIGTPGLETWAGVIREAYHPDLNWPSCQPIYSRMWRSDPEITIVRHIFEALSSQFNIGWELPEKAGLGKPSSDDKKALDFAYTVSEDITGGMEKWLTSAIMRAPFFGWAWWEVLPGIRKEGWRPPGGDPWRSGFDDGLIGFRRFAFRQYSSFYKWDLDEKSGRLDGMVQLDIPNREVTIPLERSLHLTFGDHDNPEGLATLEAAWRLERLKFQLEIVQGIGFEHSAGYLDVETDGTLSAEDLTNIKRAARSIMSAQEGNYAAWPKGMRGELKDAPFSAAAAMQEAIRYYGILKLALFTMQWVAIAALSKMGSRSAMTDASDVAFVTFNAIAKGLVAQADDQIGRRLFEYKVNREAFPGMTRRPRMTVSIVRKKVPLIEVGQFAQAMKLTIGLGEDDIIAIRRASELLPETLPDEILVKEEGEKPEPEPEPDTAADTEPDEEDEEPEDSETADLAKPPKRPFVVGPNEKPTAIQHLAPVTEKDVDRAVRKFEKWAEKENPEFARLLRAEVVEE